MGLGINEERFVENSNELSFVEGVGLNCFTWRKRLSDRVVCGRDAKW